MNAKIERKDLDASGKECVEGYYATDGRTVYLMPPTAVMVPSLRLATRAEVDRGVYQPAPAELIANCDPRPSDRPDGLPALTASGEPLAAEG